MNPFHNKKTSINLIIQIQMSFIKDFWHYMRERKKWWLVPVIIILLFFGVLIVLSSGSAIAPFIYTLF